MLTKFTQVNFWVFWVNFQLFLCPNMSLMQGECSPGPPALAHLRISARNANFFRISFSLCLPSTRATWSRYGIFVWIRKKQPLCSDAAPRHRALATEPCLCAEKRWLCSRQRALQEGELDLNPSIRYLCEAKTYPAYARSHLAPLGPQVIICGCQLSRKRSVTVSLKGIFWAFLLSPACILMGPDSGFMSSYQEDSFLCIQLALCIAHFAKWQGWICHNRSQTKWWSPACVCGASSFHARTLW